MNDQPARLSRSEAETEAIGRALATALRAGDLLALHGPLGAGKTCLVRGVAAGLGVDPVEVRSPTFVLHHVYSGGRLPLHHVDCYRLGPRAGLDVIDLAGLLEDGAVAVEWAELADLDRLDPIRIVIDADVPDRRLIRVLDGAPSRLVDAFQSTAATT